jgi:hypothetical protein
MPRTEVIGTIGFVHGTVVALVVLKSAINVPVSREYPSVMKAIVVDRVVIA